MFQTNLIFFFNKLRSHKSVKFQNLYYVLVYLSYHYAKYIYEPKGMVYWLIYVWVLNFCAIP